MPFNFPTILAIVISPMTTKLLVRFWQALDLELYATLTLVFDVQLDLPFSEIVIVQVQQKPLSCRKTKLSRFWRMVVVLI